CSMIRFQPRELRVIPVKTGIHKRAKWIPAKESTRHNYGNPLIFHLLVVAFPHLLHTQRHPKTLLIPFEIASNPVCKPL
ncbi:MAG: hypothetical protein JXB30_12080, partial [Anaerolineae bacterium]|nr:hypothetical protein [Anaerolineae bacterium]